MWTQCGEQRESLHMVACEIALVASLRCRPSDALANAIRARLACQDNILDVGNLWENIFKDTFRAGCDIIAHGSAAPRFHFPFQQDTQSTFYC